MEAEGIYVGYKYYETRYYDSIVNPDSGADSSAGATQSDAWNYDEEVLYDFGHGLSYLDYTQSMKLTGMAAAAVEIVSGILRIAATVLLTLCLVTLITARVEGLGFIYFSNADVLQEVQTPANMSSAAGTIANMICLGAATVFSMIAAFFNLRKKETQN